MADKLSRLSGMADQYGVTLEEMLGEAVFDGISPGICVNDGCDYTTDVEPDQDRGWCEVCRTNTVQSALILAGLI
jgi:hypothetical protein